LLGAKEPLSEFTGQDLSICRRQEGREHLGLLVDRRRKNLVSILHVLLARSGGVGEVQLDLVDVALTHAAEEVQSRRIPGRHGTKHGGSHNQIGQHRGTRQRVRTSGRPSPHPHPLDAQVIGDRLDVSRAISDRTSWTLG